MKEIYFTDSNTLNQLAIALSERVASIACSDCAVVVDLALVLECDRLSVINYGAVDLNREDRLTLTKARRRGQIMLILVQPRDRQIYVLADRQIYFRVRDWLFSSPFIQITQK